MGKLCDAAGTSKDILRKVAVAEFQALLSTLEDFHPKDNDVSDSRRRVVTCGERRLTSSEQVWDVLHRAHDIEPKISSSSAEVSLGTDKLPWSAELVKVK